MSNKQVEFGIKMQYQKKKIETLWQNPPPILHLEISSFQNIYQFYLRVTIVVFYTYSYLQCSCGRFPLPLLRYSLVI